MYSFNNRFIDRLERPASAGRQFVEKVCIYKNRANSQSLSPNPFPGKGAILLGLPPLVQARMLAVSHTKPLHDAVAQMADDLYGGFAPKQGRFGCLPKVLHDAKPTKQATFDTPFLSTKEVFRQPVTLRLCGAFLCIRYRGYIGNVEKTV